MQSKTTLKACKRYLKTQYPVNCRHGQPSTCPDHCRNFALSDNSDDAFKVECDHVHNTVCNSCESLKTVLREMEDQIRKEHIAFYRNDHQEDILYDFVKAKQSILDWKAHILRSCNQEKAKQDLLQNLTTSEAIVVMDWAMKFQQMKFREKQSEWFGKRVLTWHISSVIFNPIQTGLFWSICDGGGGLLGPPLCISGTNNAKVMKFTHNDHLRTKKPHTQF